MMVKQPYTKQSLLIVYWKFRRAAHSICNLDYKVPQKIPVKNHNGSSYDCHFIIKELVEEFKCQFEYIG